MVDNAVLLGGVLSKNHFWIDDMTSAYKIYKFCLISASTSIAT